MDPETEPTDQTTTTRILEINLISAQSLKIPKPLKPHRIHTYTIAWVDPKSKLRSHLDRVGSENPTWNEKFIFRVSPSFIYGDTSAVQFQIYACGFIKDYLIGNVRFLLSSSSLVSSKTGAVVGTPAFSALHIRRPSGRIHGVLNIAATVYECSDFAAFNGMSAVCFHDFVGEKSKSSGLSNRRREQRRLSWRLSPSYLSRVSSKKSEQSSSGAESSDCLIGSESTASSPAAVKESVEKVAGKKGWRSDGRGLLCGLMWQREFKLCPLDRDLVKSDGSDGKEDVKGV
ncbi:putative C2 domain-containing protein [Helianthus anomalus]